LKTPADKIRNGRNNIIQIVVTRKCDIFNCSNCTQGLPFRGRGPEGHDPWEMSLECAEAAIKSLEGFPGVIALFGGNSACSSKFRDLCLLWERLIPNQKQRGIWTNNLMQHGEIVKRVFWPNGTYNLNVHGSEKAAAEMRKWLPGWPVYGERSSHHGQVFGSHKDLGVPEDEWVAKRENCDINQNWSASIVERYGKPFVYFCEVASSIDGITGENHGIPAEKGWWKWPIERFQDQIASCCDEHCVVPLRLKGQEDLEDTYSITKSFVPLTELTISKKVSTIVREGVGETIRETTDYQRLRGN